MSKSVLVYRYGLLPPVEGGDLVREQIRLAHRYKNALVAIERERREAFAACRAKHVPGLNEIEAEIAEKDEVISALRASTLDARAEHWRKTDAPRRLSPTAETSAAVAALKVERKSLQARAKELRDSFKALTAPGDEEFARRLDAKCGERKVRVGQKRAARAVGPAVVGKAREEICAAMLAEEAWPEAWREMTRIERAAHTARIAARDACGVPHGTYLLAEDAIAQAIEDSLPAPPRFRSFEGEGSIGVQVHQKGKDKDGLSVSEVMLGEGDAANWIHLASEAAERRRPSADQTSRLAAARARNAARRAEAIERGGGDTRQRMLLRMRVGSEGSAPIFASWPIVLHRSLPAGAVVKRAAVHVKRIGPREEWSVTITISVSGRIKDPSPRTGAIAIELGWRAIDGGIQIAQWVDDAGRSGRLIMADRAPEERPDKPKRTGGGGVLSALRQADQIQGHRDDRFNAARDDLAAWLRACGMPEWMRAFMVRPGEDLPSEAQALAWLSSWRSPRKLAALCRMWGGRERGADEAQAYEALERWRYRDYHHWCYAESKRTSAVRRRKNDDLVFGAWAARTYGTVILSDTNYAELSCRPKVSGEDGKAVIDAAAYNRKLAAPGERRAAIEYQFKSRGGEIVRVASAGLSMACPKCGACDSKNLDGRGSMACGVCDYSGDIDDTAMLNMMRRAGRGQIVDKILAESKRVGQVLRGQDEKKEKEQ